MTECTNNSCKTENPCGCNNQSCGCNKSQYKEQCTMAEDVMDLAKWAKKELLKEKMKDILKAKMGKKLDKIAEVAVDAVIACMEHKHASKQACHQYEESLREAFNS